MASVTISSPRLLSELERQEYYLSQLPETYEFPLFSGKQAVESQRRSGYKDTARAAREIVDNASEAGAKNVWIVFDRPREDERAKHERKNAVTAVAFIDDGPGMLPKMARYALSWGGGTHFEEPTGIGKFGFGLPNSSINQTERVEVYTRTGKADGWVRTVLDIQAVPQHGLITIPEPEPAELPDFVGAYLKKKGIKLKSGTVVVWDKPDRLTYRKVPTLKEHLLNDFGVAYRGLLDRFNVFVDDTQVEKVDPLFLTPGARYYKPADQGGAVAMPERHLPVKYSRDEDTGAQCLDLLDSMEALEEARKDPDVLAVGVITVRLAHFPYGFAVGRGKSDDPDAPKRFEIRKPRRGMSFVRAGREIETVDVFPKSDQDKASGLGDWPLLQSYAYHWGIEVQFDPALDEAFGVGNDKQTIRPIDDFWRVLTKAGIDLAARKANEDQRHKREKKKQDEASNLNDNNAATQAAAAASAATGRKPQLPENRQGEAKDLFERAVKERAEKTGETYEKAKKAIEEEGKRYEYAITFFDAEGGVFYKPSLGDFGLQKVAMVNKAHPFFQTFYTEVAKTGSSRARQALNLLLLALADAELRAETDQIRDMYEHQRKHVWSPFLESGLKVLDRLQPSDEEEEEANDA